MPLVPANEFAAEGRYAPAVRLRGLAAEEYKSVASTQVDAQPKAPLPRIHSLATTLATLIHTRCQNRGLSEYLVVYYMNLKAIFPWLVFTAVSVASHVVVTAAPPNELAFIVLADFDDGKRQSNFGGAFGSFDGGDYSGITCRATVSLVEGGVGGRGKAAHLSFDNPASPFNSGWWLNSNYQQNENLSRYDRIGFWVRGTVPDFVLLAKDGTSTDNNSQFGTVARRVTGITEQWSRHEVLFKDMQPQIPGTRFNWKHVRQLVFVAQDADDKPLRGELFFDDIYVARGERKNKQ